MSVLSSRQISRRWRDCNPQRTPEPTGEQSEDDWRMQIVRFLTDVHSLGGIMELNFEVVPSQYAVRLAVYFWTARFDGVF